MYACALLNSAFTLPGSFSSTYISFSQILLVISFDDFFGPYNVPKLAVVMSLVIIMTQQTEQRLVA